MFLNFKTLLGKLPILVIIIIASHYHVLAGVLALLLIITLTSTVTEGMENNETDSDEPDEESDPDSQADSDSDSDLKPSKDSAKEMFKQKFCVDGKLMKDDKEVTPQQIKDAFPDINFSGESCNPCDDECDFEIISSKEKITVEENLRAVDSNSQPVDRSKAITKSE
jgi:hypothetical protein|tara:strand:+ start:296 stop:796 length:501 start_codon:yes stop_codon:yes gene_type:complete